MLVYVCMHPICLLTTMYPLGGADVGGSPSGVRVMLDSTPVPGIMACLPG